jgi:predicted RNase H-like HicB family nuclease
MSSEVTYPVVMEQQDGQFVTYVPALDFASTFGETREEALERTRELIVGYLEAAEKDGIAVAPPIGDTHIEQISVALT